MEEEKITITMKLYNHLLDDSNLLQMLESYGVDNWVGYDDAYQEYLKLKREENDTSDDN